LVSENINIRIKFEKTGKLQFISHLDLCRTMKTAIIRAGIPVWYTEGFNPHPKMIFALPLSIGTESLCEYMDFKITEEMPAEMIMKNLNDVTSNELNVTDVYIPTTKFKEIAWAEYIIKFHTGDIPDISEAVNMFETRFIINKRTKNGEKEMDIMPYIRRFDINTDTIKILLSAESDSYINPEYIASAVSERLGISDYDITRFNLYINDGVTLFK
jgi:radical SAM-linked protein